MTEPKKIDEANDQKPAVVPAPKKELTDDDLGQVSGGITTTWVTGGEPFKSPLKQKQ
jgi:hypothetical protein